MTIESDIVKEVLVKVARIWDELGIDQSYRKNQIDMASEKIIEIYNSLLKKEETYREDIIKDIISGLESLCSMSTELGETVNDNNGVLSTMSLFQRLEFIENEKGKLRKRTQDRMAIIEDLEFGIDEYSKEMELKDFNQSNVDESTIQGNDYSMDKISSLKRKLSFLKNQRDELFYNIQNISIEIVELWEELRVSPDTELEKSILLMGQCQIDKASPISLSQATLTVLEQKRNKLHIIKAEHEEMVCDYAKRITLLWDKLEIPEDERESFFSKTAGLGSDVIEACREELERVEEIRKTSLLELIEKVLNKIEMYYNQLHLPIEKLYQVVEDNGLNRNEESEDLLELYEMELIRIGKLYELSKPLLLLVEKRETIRNYKIEYEQTILGDKERLLSKKFDRARFEKEKELSTAFQKLPLIEDNLKKQLLIWQQTYNQPFTYEGYNYLELMQQQADSDKRLKESEKLKKEREKTTTSNSNSGGNSNVNLNGSGNSSNGNLNNLNNGNCNSNGGGGIKKSSSSTSISSSSAPKTPTSSRVLKTIQTPGTPKSKATMENLVQSPHGANKPLLKKRSPLSPLPIKNLTINTPGGSGRSTAASKPTTTSSSKPSSLHTVSPNKKKIQFSLNTNQHHSSNSKPPTTITSSIKKPVPQQKPIKQQTNNENINHNNYNNIQNHKPISMVITTPSSVASISSSSSSSSSSSHSTHSTSFQSNSSYYLNNQNQNQNQRQNINNNNGGGTVFKSNNICNDSIIINNHQYNDDLIMNDTFDPMI